MLKAVRDTNLSEWWCRCSGSIFARRALPAKAIAALKRKLVGYIILPDDPQYDDARKLKNQRFDQHPSAIVMCATEGDIGHCLAALRHFHTRFSVRSGGHSTAGYSANDSVLIDVRGLRNITIDAETATVAAGCSSGELHKALQPHGLHVPLGDSDVGIAGFVQGGGYGLTSRIFGMNCDNVIELRVMLADGRIVRANKATNYDLWWAMRGGTGGNFGVLLTVKYHLKKLASQAECIFYWPLPSESGSGRWQNQVAALVALQQYYTSLGAMQVGAAAGIRWFEALPKPPALWIQTTFAGAATDVETALKPLFEVPDGAVSCNLATSPFRLSHLLTDDLPNAALLATAKQNPASRRKSLFVSHVLAPDDWRSIIDKVLASPTRYPEFEIHCYGGAINAFPPHENAFIHRNASFCCFLQTRWWDDDQRRLAERHLHEWCVMMEPFWNGHVYQNFPSEDYQDYRWAYWGSAFATLLKVKKKYDPKGAFAFPQMIREGPAAAAPPPLVARALAQGIFEG